MGKVAIERPGESNGMKMQSGTYVGKKQLETGKSAAKTLTVPFKPTMFFISRDPNGAGWEIGYMATLVRGGMGVCASKDGNSPLAAEWTDTGVTFWASTLPPNISGGDSYAICSMNAIGKTYYYCVIGEE